MGAARVGMLLTAVGAVAIIAGRHEHVSAALSAVGALAATSRGGPGVASMRPGGGGNVSLTATSEAPSKTATSSSSDADGSVSATDGVDSSVVKNHCITTQLRLDVDDDISATLQDDAMPEICLAVSNEYERKLGIPIGDGKYGFDLLAEMHQDSRLRSMGGLVEYPHEFHFHEDEDSAAASNSADHEAIVRFTKLGGHRLHIVNGPLVAHFEVTVKYVRRELRDLTDDDREGYLKALSILYSVDQTDGEQIYGSEFKSIAWLVREHLMGAADKACDHWHDDAGFINHHIGITMQFEKALQTVDETVAAHYWDYQQDADLDDWTDSIIFDDTWFGAASPNNTDHVIEFGTWAYTKIMEKAGAGGWSTIHNPYGLLRSPWNTNPTPYVTRSRYVLGLKDSGYGLPSCDEFQDAMTVELWIGTAFTYLNGLLHGPVHIMTGGHWAFDSDKLSSWTASFPQFVLLSAKFLWRQGYVRCPSFCAAETPKEECACHCPAAVLAGRSSEEILNTTGILQFDSSWKDSIADANLDWDDVLELLCHVGHAGEMFTSAAPYDPLFWPLHGLAERYMQVVRYYASEGLIALDETWGYWHLDSVASDTHTYCDWSGVEDGTMQMPHCTGSTTCPGHREDDILPFEGMFPGQTYTTNREFYNLTGPSSASMSYVYDKLTSWPACDGGVLTPVST